MKIKKNSELIINHISSLENRINQRFDQLYINNNNQLNNQVINYNNGKYVGQIINGLKEEKGVYYYTNGDRYEYDYRSNNIEGKGVYYFNNGDIYKGDFKCGSKDGKGIFCWNSGDREMGDYYNDKQIEIHAKSTKNGEVTSVNY